VRSQSNVNRPTAKGPRFRAALRQPQIARGENTALGRPTLQSVRGVGGVRTTTVADPMKGRAPCIEGRAAPQNRSRHHGIGGTLRARQQDRQETIEKRNPRNLHGGHADRLRHSAPAVGGTRTTLLPISAITGRNRSSAAPLPASTSILDPPNMPFTGRAGWRPKDGKPGSDLAMVRRGAFYQRHEPRDLQRGLLCAGGVRFPYGGRLSARRSTTGSRANGLRKI
jgi:hypothetical protein